VSLGFYHPFPPAQKKFMTTKDVAEFLGVSVESVHRWRRSGKLPRPMLPDGMHPRWSTATFHKWLAEQQQKGGR
jgi:excisionase family DNA binding protein